MRDVSTDTAMHGHAQVAAELLESLREAPDREAETQIMQRLLDASCAYMVLAARKGDE